MTQLHLSFLLLIACSLGGFVSAADDWWEYGHFYQIYPRSFQDSDGDGLGDLNGITSRLEHLKNISVDGVWLSPVFESPMLDMGYDISDFTKIHREFGRMADFDRLLARCKELGIKLILDFVPNHTSDQHEWFKKSADPEHPEHYKYKDYYIWHTGKLLENGTRVPPSNWVSVFKGSQWTWVTARQKFYLHQFLKQQPDLNFRNREVMREMKKVLRFWLRKGVSGFRIDAVPHLFEVPENADGMYDDEPFNGECPNGSPEEYCYYNHTKTTHMNETYDLINQWRSVMDEDEFKDHTRVLMTEAYGSVPVMSRYYGKVKNGVVVKYGAQIPFNFKLMSVKRTSKASEYIEDIEEWINAMPRGFGIRENWVLGNHDGSRVATRYGPQRTDIYNILIKTLPGITVTYYGEEIGMTDVDTSNVPSIDERGRCRTPLQWDSSMNAGFSTNPKTWLPVADNYTIVNVELQQTQTLSHLKVFQQLMSLRQNPTFKYGTLTLESARNDELFVYKRELENQPNADVIVVVLNLSDTLNMEQLDLTSMIGDLPTEMKVAVSSITSDHQNGDTVNPELFSIGASEGIALIGSKSNCGSSSVFE